LIRVKSYVTLNKNSLGETEANCYNFLLEFFFKLLYTFKLMNTPMHDSNL